MAQIRLLLIAACSIMLAACSNVPKTNTQVPSLKYAKSYVSDAKDHNERASKTNVEIDESIKKLLEGAE